MSKKKNIKISIIITIYNIEAYLEKCIRSVLTQTYDNLEIILVDDGSVDCSGIICDRYRAKDARINVIHKPNGGVVSARKAGAHIATGDYVMNVDGDDWIEPDYVEGFIKTIVAENPDAICALGYYREGHNYSNRIIEELRKEDEYKIITGERYFSDMVLEGGLWLRCVKRDIYAEVHNSIDERISLGEDLSCTIRLYSSTENIVFANICGYHYMQRDGSIVHNKKIHTKLERQIFVEDTMEYLSKHNSKKLKNVVNRGALYAGMLYNFEDLQSKVTSYLYPYTTVKKESRIIVFGAGIVGEGIVEFISKSSDYELVAWVDSNNYGKIRHGIKIYHVGEIANREYDKIVIGTIKDTYEREILKTLLEFGIDRNKIATIDYAVLEHEFEK